LEGAGYSQRTIAATTDQSQSEIHEILNDRKVRAIEVIERIADGMREWGMEPPAPLDERRN